MSALLGKRIVVTRPREQAAALCDLLASRGALPIILPTIQISPLADTAHVDQAIAGLSAYDWLVFTSANGVAAFWARLEAAGKDAAAVAGLRRAAIGPATAAALAERGAPAHLMPAEHVGEALAAAIGPAAGQRVLLPRAETAREALADGLRRAGALVDDVAVYRTLAAEPDPAAFAELRRGVDAVTFTSASTVRSFAEMMKQHAWTPGAAVIACLGPITAQAAREAGLRVAVQAKPYTTHGLVTALARHFATRPATPEMT